MDENSNVMNRKTFYVLYGTFHPANVEDLLFMCQPQLDPLHFNCN